MIDPSCIKKALASFKKYIHSKLLIFDQIKGKIEGIHDNARAFMHLNVKTSSQ